MRFHMSEQTKIEAQLGGLIGTMIGMTGAAVVIIFFTQMELTFKIFSAIGFSGSLAMMFIQLIGLIQFRKQFIEAKKAMELAGLNIEGKLGEESKKSPNYIQ